MLKMEVFHIQWTKYIWNDFNTDNVNDKHHYGLYQMYGNHPIYGNDCLLYIGKAQLQTFGTRLSQHWDFDINHFTNITRIHLGMFYKWDDASNSSWADSIDKIERIFINAHCPAFNANNIKNLLDQDTIGNMLILNWGDYGSLLPSLSSIRYSNKYWDDNIYKDELLF